MNVHFGRDGSRKVRSTKSERLAIQRAIDVLVVMQKCGFNRANVAATELRNCLQLLECEDCRDSGDLVQESESEKGDGEEEKPENGQ